MLLHCGAGEGRQSLDYMRTAKSHVVVHNQQLWIFLSALMGLDVTMDEQAIS